MSTKEAGTTVIHTVLGPIAPAEAGVILVSEHLLLLQPGYEYAYDSTYDRATAYERIVRALRSFHEAGGGTVIDTGGLLMGRDVRFFQDLSRATGVHIVGSTGMPSSELVVGYFDPGVARAYWAEYGTEEKKWHRESPGGFVPGDAGRPEHLGRVLSNEIDIGMAAKGMYRSKARAAVLVFGSTMDACSELEKYLALATAIAQRQSGAPVFVRGGTAARALAALGVEPARIVVTRGGSGALDSKVDAALAAEGYWIAYDQIGADAAPRESSDAKLVAEVVRAGHAARLLLGTGCVLGGAGHESTERGPAYLLTEFLPALVKCGVSEAVAHSMVTDNPGRLLSGGR
jgi:phosphotriesterase-related protein